MGLFDFFKRQRKTPLSTEPELDLMPWIDGYYHRQVTYIRDEHTVRELVHFHSEEHSVWGYTSTPVPTNVKTLEALLKFLKTKDFHLK